MLMINLDIDFSIVGSFRSPAQVGNIDSSGSNKRVVLDGLDLVFKKTNGDSTAIEAMGILKRFEVDRNRRSSGSDSENAFAGRDGEDMGRHATRISVEGEIMGEDSHDIIGELRKRHLKKDQPLELISQLSLNSKVNKVIIEELTIKSVKGNPYRFQYSMKLVEYADL